MNAPTPSRRELKPKGYLLLEMVLALSVFSMAATGFVVALHRMSQAASVAQSELKATRILESALNEAISIPMLQVGEVTNVLEDGLIEITSVIEEMDDLENEEGAILDEMYRIRILARWYENGEWQEREIETWRNGKLYQP